MAVAFQELEGSPTVSVSRDSFRGERRFLIAWADLYPFLNELLGTGGVGAGIGASSPAVFPGVPNTACTGANARSPSGLITSGSLADHTTAANAYEYAEVVANYETLPAFGSGSGIPNNDPEAPTGTVITWSRNYSGDMLTVPGRAFNWVGVTGSTIVPADINPGVLVPTTSYTATWHFVKKPPVTAIRRLRGQVNLNPFHGCIAESLLFEGAEDSYSRDLNGEETYTLAYQFVEKTVVSLLNSNTVYSGWNYMLRPADPVSSEPTNWYRIGPAPYVASDFADLFQQEP